MNLNRWKPYNPNPVRNQRVGDCAIRAICKATGQDWETAFAGVMVVACEKSDMPSANSVWGTYLRRNGFRRNIIPNEYPEDYTVEEFAADHQNGVFVLGLDGHVVTVVDGFYWDTWDSGQEIPIYYWERR